LRTRAHTNAHGDCDCLTYCNINGHPNNYSYGNTKRDFDSYGNGNSYCHRDGHANRYSNGNSNRLPLGRLNGLPD
jgi:hypothetical protein